MVWPKNTIFAVQQKNSQKSEFALNQDSNPVPSGNTVADIAKKFEQNFQRKSDSAKNDFCRFSAACRFSPFLGLVGDSGFGLLI
jgi:biopolymer transport protein ExbB/TolQ